MNTQRRVMLAFCAISYITLLLIAPRVHVQATTSVRGTVQDPVGMFLPGPTITLENAGTGSLRSTITDHMGT